MILPPMPKRKWSAGRGALWIIALMLIASAIIRLGAGTGQVIAQEMAALGQTEDQDGAPAGAPPPPEIGAILSVLMAREQKVVQREKALEELAQSLAVAEDQIRVNMAALIEAENALAATIALSESAAETDLARLTSVYENMKARDAAVLFEEMAPEFAAGFIGRMRPDAAALILAGLTPRSAYTISVILAGRNALAPTE